MTILCSLRNCLFNRKLCNLGFKNFNRNIKLQITSVNNIHCVEELKDRALLKISGKDVTPFMQGLITNDMKHLEEGSRSMYTMFLNSKGRVMYDAIIYKNLNPPVIYIECDKLAIDDLQKHLKSFKIRRKVNVGIVDDRKVWIVFCPEHIEQAIEVKDIKVKDVTQEKIVPCQGSEYQNSTELNNRLFNIFSNENYYCVAWDPRLPLLGLRILAKDNINVEDVVKENGILVENLEMSYKTVRYKLGIAEGIQELPYGKCFPLEMNCDYLHGVSFHKGCYIGQELTARTHHTGVVRKRLMPIFLDSLARKDDIKSGTTIEVLEDIPRPIGKLRGSEKNIAIGLVKISDALGAKLKIGNLTGSVLKPQWWPQETPKESMHNK